MQWIADETAFLFKCKECKVYKEGSGLASLCRVAAGKKKMSMSEFIRKIINDYEDNKRDEKILKIIKKIKNHNCPYP